VPWSGAAALRDVWEQLGSALNIPAMDEAAEKFIAGRAIIRSFSKN
jgi:hypothetical protein